MKNTAAARADIYKTVERAYLRGVPIVSINTADCAATSRRIVSTVERVSSGKKEAPMLGWDCVQGIFGLNQAGKKVQHEQQESPLSIEELMSFGDELPERSVIIVYNAHLFLDNAHDKQAVWNIRDRWKANHKHLFLIGPSVVIPRELTHDVIGLDEPLPDRDELRGIVSGLYDMAEGVKRCDETIERASDSLRGVSAFAAEQIAAINIDPSGISVKGCWDSKRKKIDDTPGLRVVSNGTLSDVAGVDQVKKFLRGVLTGNDRPGAIVYVDEIEKAFGGSSSDTSGVSQDQLGVVLSWMQDRQASGMIFLGPPGAAKSATAKSAGGDFEIPTVELDLGGMKGSLVGESETKVREALKVVDGMSGGKTLWLATCNSIASLPPELKRRYRMGTWYFGLPNREERSAIWNLYCGRYSIDFADVGELLDREWTGAEIESCCDIAWRINATLQEASQYIVPISVSARDMIQGLERAAEGKCLSASKPGVYQRPEQEIAEKKPRRALDITA